MKKIYLVNRGCYSDYTVDAAFSTKEKAKEFMDAFPNGDYNEILEMIINPRLPGLRRGYGLYKILMLRNGDTESASKQNDNLYLWCNGSKSFLWKRSETPNGVKNNLKDCLSANIWARNEKHAVKITNEIRTRMIANGEWK